MPSLRRLTLPRGPPTGKGGAVAGAKGRWYTAAKSRGLIGMATFYWRLFAVTGSITAYLMYKRLVLH